jgi:LDH2 family malate/lactate/ureidoglycolate dehydrogenase
MLLPAGGVKGSGLALMIDILAGVATGSRAGAEVRGLNEPASSKIGIVVVTLVPDAFASRGDFEAGLRAYFEAFRALPPAAGTARPLLPGERSWRTRNENLERGVPLSAAVLADVERLAASDGRGRS